MLFELFEALSARFIIPFYIGVMLIIYRLYVLLIPPLAAALTVLPVFPVLPPSLSLPSFCLIGKELIFLLLVLCRLPHLPVGTLVVIPRLPIFLPGVPLLALAVMVTAF